MSEPIEKVVNEPNSNALAPKATRDEISEFSDDSGAEQTTASAAEIPNGAPAEASCEASSKDDDALVEKELVLNNNPLSEDHALPQEDSKAAAKKPQDDDRKQQKALSNDEVTEHTASLWKYLPIPSDEPDPAPEYINGTIKFPGSTVIAARVRGKKHKHEGTNCDDWYEVASYERMTFIAVSDGAGSKKFSRIGARESCKAAVGFLVSSFEKLFSDRPELRNNITLSLAEPKCMEACGILANTVQQSIIKAREAVEAAFYSRKTNPEYEKVLGRGLQLKDLSGTLLIAVIIPISELTKEHLVISCQIGDGMIAILNSEGDFPNSMKLMGVPDSGDFSGETDFLTSSQMTSIETLQHRTKISRTIVDTVMVMSDGVADDYFPNETQMHRLYFDLVVNGILDKQLKQTTLATLTPTQMKLFKRIPDPLIYPWVNDQSIRIPVQYMNRVLESTGLTLEDVWRDQTVLNLARLELEKSEECTDASETLKSWLDNYVERGSFDDRTLVVATM